MKMSGKIDFLLNLNASPYHAGRWKERNDNLKIRARAYKAEIIYVNLIGGQDELVFDGHSLAMDKKGKLTVQGRQFFEDRVIFDRQANNRKTAGNNIKKIPYKIKGKSRVAAPEKFSPMEEPEEIYNALMLGVKDYVEKNGFKKVVVALSGGVDSALVSCIAADALGKENISVIFMPSKFSSQESFNDSKKLSGNLKISFKVISIQEIFGIYLKNLEPYFGDLPFDSTEENLQARIRGNIVMAFSNKFQWLVLTTGNKSEMSTGYATLYGDMAGGFAVIKDVPKTLVYKLVEWRNKKAGYDLIPENILKKAPTAELKENQKDQDTLPEYPLLDRIIEDYIEKDKTYSELKNKYDEETLKKVIRMIDINEYKRRQAAPGIKITPKAFGRDRRIPITNKYKE
jgi:NAD+ synthase (glutamine-hydrolysing)